MSIFGWIPVQNKCPVLLIIIIIIIITTIIIIVIIIITLIYVYFFDCTYSSAADLWTHDAKVMGLNPVCPAGCVKALNSNLLLLTHVYKWVLA